MNAKINSANKTTYPESAQVVKHFVEFFEFEYLPLLIDCILLFVYFTCTFLTTGIFRCKDVHQSPYKVELDTSCTPSLCPATFSALRLCKLTPLLLSSFRNLLFLTSLPGLPVYLFLPHNSSHSFGSSVAMH
jgi:hypothetical protein